MEIHRQTGISYKSCLFLLHRIRFAMADSAQGLLTGIVEVDEAYLGGKPGHKNRKRPEGRKTSKQGIMGFVERGGRVKTKPIANVTAKTLKNAIRENVHPSARIMTDENPSYRGIGNEYVSHETVCHTAGEYARGDVTTNSVESFFAVVKRGLHGIYHSVSKEHLHRYLSEYEFRYNHRELDDGPRTLTLIKASEGKRLYYKEPVRKPV